MNIHYHGDLTEGDLEGLQYPDLKPCPFCGGAAYWDELDIECEGNPTCYVRPRVTGCDTIEEAATAWNTRHGATS